MGLLLLGCPGETRAAFLKVFHSFIPKPAGGAMG